MAFAIHLVLAFLSVHTLAARFSGPREDVTSTVPQSPDLDLDSGFIRGALSDSLKQSLSLIEKAESLPSCSKFATSALFHSCQSLEGSINHDSPLPAGSDLLIEEESGIYAARLAVCELQGADFVVPTACRSFIPVQDHKRKRTVRGWLAATGPSKPTTVHEYYDEVTEANLKQCRQALGSSSQAWTSYSNNRQNAVAMCHAMQSAVEQDESRHIAKILTHTAAATSESLQEAYEQVNEIKRRFHELRTAMPKFQQDLASFDGALQQRVQAYWDQLANARSGLESLTVAIDRSQQGMQEIQTHLHSAVKDLIPELVLEIARAKQQASDTAETAAASTELVAYAVQKTEQNLIARLDTAGHDLAAINELMPELRGHIEMTLSNSVSFLEAATSQQYEFVAAQNRTMEGMERMQQTAEDANSKLDGFVSTLASVKELFDQLEPYFGPVLPFVAFVFSRFKMLGAATFFGLCSVVFWHEHVQYSWGGSSVAAFASTIVCAAALNVLHKFNIFSTTSAILASISQSAIPWALGLLAFAGACIFAFFVAATAKYIYRYCRGSPPQVQEYDPYDPLSPPSGAQAWKVWLLDGSRADGMSSRRYAMTLPKSTVLEGRHEKKKDGV